jgi:O-antigen/teichoic acid export membrane protein
MWVGLADYVGYGALFLLTVLVGRFFGLPELGRFGTATALATLVITSFARAYSGILRRDLAAFPERRAELFGTAFTIRVVGTVAMMLVPVAALELLVGTAWENRLGLAGPEGRQLGVAVAWLFAIRGADGGVDCFLASYQAERRFRLYAGSIITQQSVALGLAWALMQAGHPIGMVYASQVLVALLALTGHIWLVFFRNGLPFVTRPTVVRELTIEAWPLLINGFVFMLGSRLGVLLTARLIGQEAAGVYTALQNVIMGISLVAGGIGTALFPRLSVLHRQDPLAVWALARSWTLRLAGAGVGFGSVCWVAAPLVVRLYSRLPPESIGLFRIMTLSLVATFAQPGVGYVFTAIRRQRAGMWFASVQTVLAFGALWWAISGWGLLGAAWGMVFQQWVWVVTAYGILATMIPIWQKGS